MAAAIWRVQATGQPLKYAETYPDTCLAACCDIIPESAEYFKEKFGFQKAYTDYKTMLQQENPDVVSLISLVDKTVTMATQILKMGYPLILENHQVATYRKSINYQPPQSRQTYLCA